MKNECVHKHNWLTMIRCNIAIPKIPLHCDNYYLSCIDIIPAYHPNMDGRVSFTYSLSQGLHFYFKLCCTIYIFSM